MTSSDSQTFLRELDKKHWPAADKLRSNLDAAVYKLAVLGLIFHDMLHHLAPNGSMALLLTNGSMSSNSSGEGDSRRALIEADLVECMVALPDLLAVDPIKVTIARKARIVSHSPSRKEIINAN